jgi:valyl-tRNA synthetase
MLQLPAGEANVLRERLSKQLQPLEKARDSSKRQLASDEFVSKAPAHVVDSIRKKLGDYESQIERIRATLDSLS